jgi:hypothetical protein
MRNYILEYCGDNASEEQILLDEIYDDCLLGVTSVCFDTLPAYDYLKLSKMIEKNKNLSPKEAIDFFNEEILDKYPYTTFINYYNDIKENLSKYNGDMLFIDGMDSALIGFKIQKDCDMIAAYDDALCIQSLIDDGMEDETEAIEYFEYNVRGSYVGENTPCIVTFI